jgi:DNA-binding transcriptional MerR regulator
MSKAAEAFRTIAEVADELEVPKHVLRFWEAKFPQIRPMKRGGGRRYYRPEDMELLRGIRHLLHAEGYTIKGVQKILREHGIDQVKDVAEKVAKQQATEAPKAKRGRRALKTPETRASVAPVTAIPAAAEASTGPAQRRNVIDKLLAELELCRKLLAAGAAAPAQPPSAVPVAMRAAPASRRRSVG